MTDNALAATDTPRLAVGFGHGVTNLVGDRTCDNWIGMISADSSVNRSATSYQWDANQLVVAKKVGTTLTTGGALNAALAYIFNQALAATADRTVFFVDLTKGAPNYSVRIFYRSSSTVVDTSQATFLLQMAADPPSLTGYTYGANAALAFDETAGALDTVQLWWDRYEPNFEISDLAVRGLA